MRNIKSKIWRQSLSQNAITFFPLCTLCLLASSKFVFAWKYTVSSTEFYNIYFFLPSSPLTFSVSVIAQHSNFICRENYRKNMKKFVDKCQRSYLKYRLFLIYITSSVRSAEVSFTEETYFAWQDRFWFF